MNILITGGVGFIGSTLAIKLQELNHNITLLDIEDNNKGTKIYQKYKNIDFVQGDVNNSTLLETLFNSKEFDGIIHLAAVSRVVVAQNNPQKCVEVNVGGSISLLESLKNRDYTKKPWLIFGSSREVYGEPKILPVKESFEKKFVNIYGDSKIQGENLFIDFAKRNGHSSLILRFANVYGNEFDIFDRVIPRFIRAIAKDRELTVEGGGQVIDFTHIDDTVDTIIKAIGYMEDKFVIDDFHILPGVGWSLYEAIGYIEKILGKKAKVIVNSKRNYDVEKFIGDATKIRTILKSREFKTLKEGLRVSIERYLV